MTTYLLDTINPRFTFNGYKYLNQLIFAPTDKVDIDDDKIFCVYNNLEYMIIVEGIYPKKRMTNEILVAKYTMELL